MTVPWLLFYAAVVAAWVLALLGVARAVRAAINTRPSGPPAWWAALLAAGALLAVPVAGVLTYLLLPVPVTERTLTHSVEREAKSAGLYSASSCAARAGEGWRCKISDRPGSGFADDAVTAGDQCWHATLRNDDFEGEMPARVDGCATLRDAAVVD